MPAKGGCHQLCAGVMGHHQLCADVIRGHHQLHADVMCHHQLQAGVMYHHQLQTGVIGVAGLIDGDQPFDLGPLARRPHRWPFDFGHAALVVPVHVVASYIHSLWL
jgi:hypothetical protein